MKFVRTFMVWSVVLFCALLRGGRGGESWLGAECGGELYWGLFLLNLALLFAFTVFFRELVMTRYEFKELLGHQPMIGDLRWTRDTTLQYPTVAIGAGVAAGLLGIGGGMVLGPLLVALGCDPMATAATSVGPRHIQ